MKRSVILVLVLTVSLLSACGFRMRGSAFYDDLPFTTAYLVLPSTSLFGAEFARNMRASAKTKIVENPKDAQAIIEVMDEQKSKAFLSLNVQGRAREYSLTYTVTFRVRDNKNAQLMPPTRVSASRTLIYNELVALGRESEEEMLYREMQYDLVQQVLRRLGAIKMPGQPTLKAPATPAAPATPPKEPNATAP